MDLVVLEIFSSLSDSMISACCCAAVGFLALLSVMATQSFSRCA